MDIFSLRKALLNPEIYPDLPKEVKCVETHISILFLTGKYVYKVKKPVDFGFLDFTSLEKRKYFCKQEVVLNRRLAAELYLGVVSIIGDGNWVLLESGEEGGGRVVEYAVQMKQIPEEMLMDRLLAIRRVTPTMIDAVANKLAKFYSSAETGDDINRFARPERVKQDTDENFEQTERYIDVTSPQDAYKEVREKTNQFLRTKGPLFDERIASGRIRDCHGDLRLEHIFWGDEIAIFDCIEFNKRFRYTDIAADIAFLAMDLDYRDREDLSRRFIRSFVETSGDRKLPDILGFYQCYRAYVRGKVESFRLDDPDVPEEEKKKVLENAKKYFQLSSQYARKF